MTGEGAAPATDVGVEQPAEPQAVRPPLRTRFGWPAWLGAGFVVVALALGVLVATGVTRELDEHTIARLRPGNGWGVAQQTWSPWMSRLNPGRMYAMLGVTCLAMAVWRRSWWPVVFGAVLAGVSMALTVAVKLALERPDPHGFVSATGGSYPSGHMVAVVVCSAGCLLVVFRRARWWMWTPLLVAAGLMTSGLLVAAAHWPTDLVGGALLALGVVGLLSRTPVRRRALTSRRRHPGAVGAVH